MFENRFVAGMAAGIPISLLCLGYVLVRRDEVVRLFTDGGTDALSPGAATVLALVAAGSIGPGLGLVAGLVQGWVPSRDAYLALAVVLATLFSLGAVVARTPMTAEKTVLNYVVAMMLGLVAPRLVAA